MTITLVLPDLDFGGAQKVMLCQAKELISRGYQVSLLVIRRGGGLSKQIPVEARRTFLLPERTPKWIFPFMAAIAIAIYFQRNRYDIVISSITGANLITALILSCLGKSSKLIIRHENSGSDTKGFLRKLMVKKIYPLSKAIVTVSNEAKEDLESLLMARGCEIIVIRNPVDYQLIRRLSLCAGSLAIPGDSAIPLVVAIGRLEEQKDFEMLIHAVREVLLEVDMQLVILGEGSLRIKLSNLINELGLAQRVFLMGSVENPYAWLAASRLFVLSSRWEGFPVSLIEAVLLGVPVVSTDCRSGPREILEDGCYGELVPVGNVVMMRQKLLEILKTQRQRHEVSAGLIERYSPQSCVDEHLKLV